MFFWQQSRLEHLLFERAEIRSRVAAEAGPDSTALVSYV